MALPLAAKDSLLAWYHASARALPWRETRDPYRILVSEFMLQQTQVERVIPKYHAFLDRFPSLEALAAASTAEVIRAWAGLGYNRRAINLQRACRAIIERHGGVVPRSVEELAALPGIGPYTAGAVACFAHGQDVAFVDVNIRRVLHRIAIGPDIPAPRLSSGEVIALARAALPDGNGYAWNQALMELGATLCRARSAACAICPVLAWCAAAPSIQTALATTSRAPNGSTVPFEQTSRFARGRILDVLRASDGDGLPLTTIAAALAHGGVTLALDQIDDYLSGLARDGLVEIVQPARLAEDPSAYDGQQNGSRRIFRLPS